MYPPSNHYLFLRLFLSVFIYFGFVRKCITSDHTDDFSDCVVLVVDKVAHLLPQTVYLLFVVRLRHFERNTLAGFGRKLRENLRFQGKEDCIIIIYRPTNVYRTTELSLHCNLQQITFDFNLRIITRDDNLSCSSSKLIAPFVSHCFRWP